MPEAGTARLDAGAVLFDLDGTLLDTAPDLAAALNRMRDKRGLPPLTLAQCRPQASHGTRGLLSIGFDVIPGHAGFEALRDEFLGLYEDTLTANSPLFDGMAEVLASLEARRIPWGVVTNKPTRYTEPLLDHHGLLKRAACVVSGDTCARPKPHPEPILHACEVAGITINDCVYVGDAERDMQAARAAGMSGLVALYGYLDANDRPHEWGARGYLCTPADLLDWMGDGA